LRVLVTGGAGFIGSAVVDRLVELGHHVLVLDSLSSSAHDVMPEYLNAGAEYVWADVTDQDAVGRAVARVDAVCHQAARVGLGVDFDDVVDYVEDNDRGTAVLLCALHRERWQGRIVLASSMVVYGEGAYLCSDHGTVRPGPRSDEDLARGCFESRCPACGSELIPADLDERSPLEPRNVYAATKLHQEHLCEVFARETGSSLCSLRYHNVYGPRMPRDTPYAGVASIFRSALASGRAPQVFEDGRQRRDFVHVSDVAAANVAALDANDDVIGPFNVATGDAHTVGEMAWALRRAFGPDCPEPVVTGRYRLGDVRHVTASSDRAARLLGFKPTVSFAQGMAELAGAPLRAKANPG
jgi:dTDP-L-rhamnose 4-epimerase